MPGNDKRLLEPIQDAAGRIWTRERHPEGIQDVFVVVACVHEQIQENRW